MHKPLTWLVSVFGMNLAEKLKSVNVFGVRVMMNRANFSLALLASMLLAGSAFAATIVEEPGSNLQSFTYAIDEQNRVVSLYEVWGPDTSRVVLLKFLDWDASYTSWRIDKYVTNLTGDDWNSFTHELLQADGSHSHDYDGLSFAQYGNPFYPRSSDRFPYLEIDEHSYRDYLRYFGGVVASGESVFFSYGVTNRRNTPETIPFYLRQSEIPLPVPEPATWAMLTGGFALVGAGLRLRRRGRARA